MAGEAWWPETWVGTWVAVDGKAVVVERGELPAVTVTVAPAADAAPYVKELLGGGTAPVERLPAPYIVDDDGRRCLEVEAGTPRLGPTYRLYPTTDGPAGTGGAPHDTHVADVMLVPTTAIGLYDDFEDDQGVPWAYPLEPLRWVAPADATETATGEVDRA